MEISVKIDLSLDQMTLYRIFEICELITIEIIRNKINF